MRKLWIRGLGLGVSGLLIVGYWGWAQSSRTSEQDKSGAESEFSTAQSQKPAFHLKLIKAVFGKSKYNVLKDEIHSIAEALRKESKNKQGTPQDRANRAKRVVESFRGTFSPELQPVLDRLIQIFDEFPKRDYAQEHPGDVMRAIARQLEVSAQRASSSGGIPKEILKDLYLPTHGEIETEALFPKNISLKKFKKLNPIIVWLLKHRRSLPGIYTPVVPFHMKKDQYNVQIGVILEGVVQRINRAVDGDIVFDVEDIHCEITPEDQIFRKIKAPVVGSQVKVYGWSYYDLFHEDEAEEEKELTANRATVWEVHPVNKIEVLP
ncbi:MAG: hypothetical protein HY400_06425 [Elusimicrobia bacterium]|nr:hypothetical protein [Elusimicrobiota bacterium]